MTRKEVYDAATKFSVEEYPVSVDQRHAAHYGYMKGYADAIRDQAKCIEKLKMECDEKRVEIREWRTVLNNRMNRINGLEQKIKRLQCKLEDVEINGSKNG